MSRHSFVRAVAPGLAVLLLGACQTAPPSDDGQPPSTGAAPVSTEGLIGPTWTLVATSPAPIPPSPRAATIVFEPMDRGVSRAGGVAGCNRWGSQVTVTPPDGMRFGDAMSTKMFCEGAMDLETRFLGLIAATRTFRRAGDTLVLVGERGEGRFVVR